MQSPRDLSKVESVKGCLRCINAAAEKFSNIKEAIVDVTECCPGEGPVPNFLHDQLERVYFEYEEGSEYWPGPIHAPKALRVIHLGDAWMEPLSCPNLEEVACYDNGESPPIHEFCTPENIKRVYYERCGDEGENPMMFLKRAKLEVLGLETVTPRNLQKQTSLRVLSTGTKNITPKNAESLSRVEELLLDAKFNGDDEYERSVPHYQEYRALVSLKTLFLDNFENLQAVREAVEFIPKTLTTLYITIDYIPEKGKELCPFIQYIFGHFPALQTVEFSHYSHYDWPIPPEEKAAAEAMFPGRVRIFEDVRFHDDFVSRHLTPHSTNPVQLCGVHP